MDEKKGKPNTEKLKIFDCEVYHGGGKTHSIPKRGITMKEIVLLRAIHGQDAILDRDIKEVGEKEFNERELLFGLARAYANTVDPLSGKKLVEKVLSVPLTGFENWLQEQAELDQMERDERHAKFQRDLAADRARDSARALALATAGSP